MRNALLLATLALPGAALAGNAYTLGANDEIAVMVHGEDDISRTTVVPQSCTVDVHFLGPVEVCGRTTAEVAGDIRKGLRDGEILLDPHVVVDVTRYGSHVVEIAGQVEKPGTLALAGPTSLSQVIANAGGPASSNVLHARVIRDGGQEVTDHFLPDLERRSEPVLLGAGDRVVLLEPVNVYVRGEVHEQGEVAYREGLTVTEALSMAGGPTQFAGLARTYILRSDGEKVRVNIRRISRGQEADVALEPDDQLIVRRSVF